MFLAGLCHYSEEGRGKIMLELPFGELQVRPWTGSIDYCGPKRNAGVVFRTSSVRRSTRFCLCCGSRSLPTIASGPPDVVILDVEAEGIQVCRQLRVTPTTRLTPILLIADERPDESEIVRALTCGADDYVEASLACGAWRSRSCADAQ